MTLEDTAFSRPLATTETLGDLADDRHRFLDKRVLLTGETGVLSTLNGRECILSALRLLVRICPNMSVVIPQDHPDLLRECREVAVDISFGKSVEFTDMPDVTAYDAILNVGHTAIVGQPITLINSNGWLARVSSGQTNLSNKCSQFNPITCLAAASLGTAEIFKRLIALKPRRGKLLDATTFNLFSYRTDDSDPGPPLPVNVPIDLLIVGAGAIGNGVVYSLSRLPITGRAIIVDRQTFGRENLGTSLLIGQADVGKDKAVFAADFLRSRTEAKGYREELGVFRQRLGNEMSYPKVAIGCLDNVDTRHELQRLWTDLIIDGAIGDFGCQISRHLYGQDNACLICLFRVPFGEKSEDIASRTTGLSRERSHHQLDKVTEDDVSVAPEEKQDWLRDRIGHQICSVVQEAVAQAVSDRKLNPDFQPSVPFVATLSASMVVAELVKHIAGWSSPLDTRFQMDILQGPAFGQMLPQESRRDCECMTRRRNIDFIRQRRVKQKRPDEGLHSKDM